MSKCLTCKFNNADGFERTCPWCSDFDRYESKYVIPNLDNILGLNEQRREIAESPALQYLHDPDSNPVLAVVN